MSFPIDVFNFHIISYLSVKEIQIKRMICKEVFDYTVTDDFWRMLMRRDFDKEGGKDDYEMATRITNIKDVWDLVDIAREGLFCQGIPDLDGKILPLDKEGNLFYERFIMIFKSLNSIQKTIEHAVWSIFEYDNRRFRQYVSKTFDGGGMMFRISTVVMMMGIRECDMKQFLAASKTKLPFLNLYGLVDSNLHLINFPPSDDIVLRNITCKSPK